MTFSAFQEAVERREFAPVYLFHGEEPYIARLGVALLKRAVLTPGSEAFDLVSLIGRETTAEAIVAQAGTVPMLSESRLTVVYEFDDLGAAHRTKLLDYMKNPVASSCLALVSFKRLSAKNKFERGALESATVVECDHPSSETLAILVERMASKRGISLSPEALLVLLDWTDGRLNRIDNELDKLSAYTEGRETVTVDDIEQVVGAKASSLRDLALSVTERRQGDALVRLAELIEGGVDVAQLVSQLYGCWVGLWLARTRPEQGRGGGWRSHHVLLGMPDLREKALLRTSREYARGIGLFYKADLDIRKGLPPKPTVGLLVCGLAGDADRA